MKVSVVVPVYNAELYVEQCLTSIAQQSHKELEIICVDDGSVDGSLAVLEAFAARDSRVRILLQPNKGAGAARNAGMDAASGTHILFLDSDDFFEPKLVEKALRACKRHDADFCVYGSDQFFPEQDIYFDLITPINHRLLPSRSPFSPDDIKHDVFKAFVGWPWDKMYKLGFLREQGLRYPELRNTEDMVFVFAALLRAQRIVVINDVLAHQRVRKASLSQSRSKHWGDALRALKLLRAELIATDKYEERSQDFINYALHYCLWSFGSLDDEARLRLFTELKDHAFSDFGIASADADFFYNERDYRRFKNIMAMTYSEFLVSEIEVREEMIEEIETSRTFRAGRTVQRIANFFRR